MAAFTAHARHRIDVRVALAGEEILAMHVSRRLTARLIRVRNFLGVCPQTPRFRVFVTVDTGKFHRLNVPPYVIPHAFTAAAYVLACAAVKLAGLVPLALSVMFIYSLLVGPTPCVAIIMGLWSATALRDMLDPALYVSRVARKGVIMGAAPRRTGVSASRGGLVWRARSVVWGTDAAFWVLCAAALWKVQRFNLHMLMVSFSI